MEVCDLSTLPASISSLKEFICLDEVTRVDQFYLQTMFKALPGMWKTSVAAGCCYCWLGWYWSSAFPNISLHKYSEALSNIWKPSAFLFDGAEHNMCCSLWAEVFLQRWGRKPKPNFFPIFLRWLSHGTSVCKNNDEQAARVFSGKFLLMGIEAVGKYLVLSTLSALGLIGRKKWAKFKRVGFVVRFC